MSHAGISDGLNELERSIGTPLLVRCKAKGVTPTVAGRRMLPLARRMLQDAAGVERIGQSGHEDLTGELSISCTLALSPALIPLIAAEFAELHPNVNLIFDEGVAAEVLQAVRDGQVDVGLLFQNQLPAGQEHISICPIRVRVALPAIHPLAQRPTVSLTELADEPAIAPKGTAKQAMVAVMLQAGVEPRIRWTFGSPETVRAVVGRGFGYSLVDVCPPTVEPGSSSVVYVPVSDELPGNALVMLLPPGRRRIAMVDKLEEILRSDAVRLLIG